MTFLTLPIPNELVVLPVLGQTIAATLLQRVQVLWKRAALALDIIRPGHVSSCIGNCSLQLLPHVIKAAPLKWRRLQRTPGATPEPQSQASQPLLRITPRPS